MVIVFDMDNTLVDEFCSSVRPGIIDVLEKLKHNKHTLVLWTNSRRERAKYILSENGLSRYFKATVCREDYDPDETGRMKDIRKVKGDILIDDDPNEIKYVKSIKKKGILVKSYRKRTKLKRSETEEILGEISKSGSVFKKWFGSH